MHWQHRQHINNQITHCPFLYTSTTPSYKKIQDTQKKGDVLQIHLDLKGEGTTTKCTQVIADVMEEVKSNSVTANKICPAEFMRSLQQERMTRIVVKKKKKKKNLLCVIPIKEMLLLLLGAPLIPIVLHQPPGHLVVVLHLAAVHSRHSQADGSTRPTALGSPVPLPG